MKRTHPSLLIVFVLAALASSGLSGCDDGVDGDGDVDAAAAIPDADVPDAPLDAGDECHSLAQSADLIEQIAMADAPPAPIGGEIPDGTYHLVASTVHTGADGMSGPTGISERTTTSCASLTCRVRAYFSTASDEVRGVTVFDPDGTRLTATRTCPQPEQVQNLTYSTVTDGDGIVTVTLYETSFLGYTTARAYELQP